MTTLQVLRDKDLTPKLLFNQLSEQDNIKKTATIVEREGGQVEFYCCNISEMEIVYFAEKLKVMALDEFPNLEAHDPQEAG